MQEEEDELEKWRTRRPTTERPETPLLFDISNAARKLGMTPIDFRWEIHTYARRNLLCHSNITHLIHSCDWQRLAERTSKDLATLQYAYPGRGKEQMEMRKTIKRFQAEYFKFVLYEDGELTYEICDRAVSLSEKRMQRALDRQGHCNTGELNL